MKKFITIIISMVITISISFSALAANVVVNGGTETAEVRGTYKVPEPTKVYSVDISWQGLDFTYNGPSKGVWNPKTHLYENPASEGLWNDTNGTITVTNHSNTDIKVTPVYQAKSGYESASMVFKFSELPLKSADNGNDGVAGVATTGKIPVEPSGYLPAGTPDNTVIGEITVTISDAANN